MTRNEQMNQLLNEKSDALQELFELCGEFARSYHFQLGSLNALWENEKNTTPDNMTVKELDEMYSYIEEIEEALHKIKRVYMTISTIQEDIDHIDEY